MGGVRRKGDVPAPQNILSYRTAPDVGSSVTDFNETLVRRTHTAAAMCWIARHTYVTHTHSQSSQPPCRTPVLRNARSINTLPINAISAIEFTSSIYSSQVLR